MSSYINLRYIYATITTGAPSGPQDFFNSEALFRQLKEVNKDKPKALAFLERLFEHLVSSKMTKDEVLTILKWEVSRHPEWNIDISKIR